MESRWRIVVLVSLMFITSLGSFAQTKIDASQLLTKEEAAAILGASIKDVKTNGDGLAYSSATFVAVDGTTVVVLVQISRDAASAQAVFDRNRASSKSTSGVEPAPVSGLGDRAFWAGGNANTLAVSKGRYWLSIAAILLDNPLEPAKRLAAKVLPRLP